MSAEYQVPPTYYFGRKWDAPMTDDSFEVPEELAESLLDGTTDCTLCQEPLLPGENIFLTAYMTVHTECEIRMALGNVQHLEGRCICFGGKDDPQPGENEQSIREQSLAAVEWLIQHNRGRFHD